jgi:hypothetical protein
MVQGRFLVLRVGSEAGGVKLGFEDRGDFEKTSVFGELGVLALDRLPRLAPANAARETRPRAG